MADTIQRRRYMEGHRVSCNVGIGGVRLQNMFFEGENSTFAHRLILPFGFGIKRIP